MSRYTLAPLPPGTTPIGTRLAWHDDAGHVVRGSVFRHHRLHRFLWIEIQWDGGRGRGRFLDDYWPPELRTMSDWGSVTAGQRATA